MRVLRLALITLTAGLVFGTANADEHAAASSERVETIVVTSAKPEQFVADTKVEIREIGAPPEFEKLEIVAPRLEPSHPPIETSRVELAMREVEEVKS